MCLRGCLRVFVSLPRGARTLLGIGGPGSHPLPAAPMPGPLRAADPPLPVWPGLHPHPWSWVLVNSSIPLPAQGPGLCRPPSPGGGRVTLQVSRRVQIFLVSGFRTPHCLLRSHSFPVGRAVSVSLRGASRRPEASWASAEEPRAPHLHPSVQDGSASPLAPFAAQALLSGDSKPQTGQHISTHRSRQGPAVEVPGAWAG